MRKILRLTVPAVIVLLTLVLSALWATPALADDGTPPTTAPADVSAPASAAPSSAAPAPAAAAPADVSAPASNTASNPASLLSQVPKGTRFVVTDASGKAISLASQKAAQAVVKGDPTWCPTGVNPGGTGCSGPQPSFNALLGLMSNKTVAGTIWIETSYNSSIGDSGGVNIVGSSLGLTENYALTLKGGWNGSSGTLAAITGASTFTVPLTINWNSDVTLSNIIVTVGLTGSSSTTALSITTPTNVTLTGVNVHDNINVAGAKIDNRSGTGTVTVSNSTFYGNKSGDGLDIYSKGAITLNNVIAGELGDPNGSGGAMLDNCGYGTQGCTILTAAPVTVTGGSFSYNGGTGLTISSTGTITVTGLTATNNGWSGVSLDNCNSYIYNTANGSQKCSTSVAHAVTLNGTNNISYNGSDGLDLNSNGAITINNLTANYNTTLNGYGRGADINNCNNTYNPNGGICTVASAPVTLTGINTFNNNSADGLQIDSIGAITISNLNANYNGGVGAQLNNCENYGIPQCSTSVVHAVTLTGNSTFDNNYYDGLDITAYGPIVASNIIADDNGTSASDVNALYYTGGSGASWDNCLWSNSTGFCAGSSTVTLTGINQFNGNYSDLISTDPSNPYNFPQGGLTITSGGAITVNNVTANGDLGGDGAYIYNNITATAQAITVNNTLSNTFNGNAVNGLEVDSIGVINVSNITANTNGKDGAYLDNCIQYNSGQCSVAAAQSVTVTNTALDTFNGNHGNGLDVESYGSITASNLNASDNGTSSTSGTGVSLNNDYANYKSVNSTGTVTLVGVNQFNSNWYDGLDVYSKGVITLTSITANGNGLAHDPDPNTNPNSSGYGLYVDNTSSGTAVGQNVTLTGTNQFNSNWLDGLVIYSYGNLALNSVTASNNGGGHYDGYGSGAWLDNCTSKVVGTCRTVTPKTIALTGNNAFENNFGYGLWVSSKGAITVNNVNADGNGSDGSSDGAYLDDDFTGAVGGVSVTNTATYSPSFNNNKGNDGLEVYSLGTITVMDLDATGNSNDGVYLKNFAGTGNVSLGTARVGWVNSLSGNRLDGLYVDSQGLVTLANIDAENNGYYDDVAFRSHGYGAYIDNIYPATGIGVTLTGTNIFNGNYLSGLEIYSNGNITLNSIEANNNGYNDPSSNDDANLYGYGVHIDNMSALTPKTVTLTGINQFNGNLFDGLVVYSIGVITVNSITANNNGQAVDPSYCYGASLDNSAASTPQSITLTGVNEFDYNWSDGLNALSKGAITLTDVDAIGNKSDGAYLDNTAGTVAAGVALTGTNVFSENVGFGLEVHTNGAITANNLVNNSNVGGPNGWSGAYLDNCGSGLGTICTTSTVAPVTLTGSNQFKFNAVGLIIFSNGAVTLSNLTANDNSGGSGLWLDNSHSPIFAGVTLTGINAFNRNNSTGLSIFTRGPVTISNLASTNNGFGANTVLCGTNTSGCGADIENYTAPTPQPVTLTGSSFMTGNYSTNLYVYTKGAITINNLESDNSQNGLGVWLNNQDYGSLTATSSVTLTGYASFGNNYEAGLQIQSWGNISLANVSANNDGQGKDLSSGGGVYLDNCLYNTGTNLCTATLPRTVTLTGNNNFNNNYTDGLNVNSLGAITVNNVTASDNGRTGAFLTNNFPTAVGGVSVTNTPSYGSNFNSNGRYNNLYNGEYDGLDILSHGTITVMDINAQSNTGDGVYLNNTSNTAGTAAVNLGTARAHWNNWLSWNTDSGLEVYSNGLVTLSNLDAEGDGNYNGTTFKSSGYGVLVNNSNSSLSQGVTLNGTNNTFRNNYLSGLEIYTKGVVTTNNIDAERNGYNDPSSNDDANVYGYGVLIDNCAYTSQCTILTPKAITLNGQNNYNNNYSGGLYVYGNGAITANAVNSNNNIAGSGASFINNANPAAPQSVTLNALNGTSNFYGNADDGLLVQSFGLVTLNSVNADTNKVDGIHVDNATGALASQLKGVTILGYANVYNNPGFGLFINSLGAVTINTIDAENQNGVGVIIDNHLGKPGIGVTFTGNIVTSNNKNEGMDVLSDGPIAFNNLSDAWIGYNGSYGWYLDNDYLGAVGGITMTIAVNQNIDFGNNGGYGLSAQSLGAITTNNLDANGNGGNGGALLDNAFPGAATTATITMNNPSTTDNYFNNNKGDGLDVLSNRAITLNTITAQNNGGYGAYIDNCGYNSGTGTCTSTITPAPGVTLTGNNNFSNNPQLGLWLTSKGAITVSNLSANNNTLGGAYLDNCEFNGTSCTTSTVAAVTLTGSNYFIGNNNQLNDGLEDGLDIFTAGAITVNNLNASNNDGIGASLQNCWWNIGLNKCTGSGNITLTGTNTFSYNYGDGLDADTHGNIILNNVTADNNGGKGVYGVADGSILVACGSMTNNGGYGWSFSAGTTATLKGVFAFGNNGGLNTYPAGGTLTFVRTCP